MSYLDSRILSKALGDFIKGHGPEQCAPRLVEKLHPAAFRPSRIFCLGKAANGLATAAAGLWPGVPGLLYGTEPLGSEPMGFRAIFGDHPFPTKENARRTGEVERWIEGGEGPLLALISGGGSSLLVHPLAPWTLAEKAGVTEALWRGGTSIRELNAVRSRLSAVKAGGLRRLAGRGPVATGFWSDVGPGDARLVSSGPTLPWRGTLEAEEVLAKFKIRPPRPLPPPEKGRAFKGDSWFVLHDARRLARACAGWIEGRGFKVRVMPAREGEDVSDLARRMARWLRLSSIGGPVACVGSGEATLAAPAGRGLGGRCSHLAALLAIELAMYPPQREWCFAALATDGVDGSGGGGAFVDSSSLPSAAALRRAILALDTGRLWRDHGGLVPRAPTGNNLRDLWVLVAGGRRGP